MQSCFWFFDISSKKDNDMTMQHIKIWYECVNHSDKPNFVFIMNFYHCPNLVGTALWYHFSKFAYFLYPHLCRTILKQHVANTCFTSTCNIFSVAHWIYVFGRVLSERDITNVDSTFLISSIKQTVMKKW